MAKTSAMPDIGITPAGSRCPFTDRCPECRFAGVPPALWQAGGLLIRADETRGP